MESVPGDQPYTTERRRTEPVAEMPPETMRAGRTSRKVPVLRLVAFYTVLIGLASALCYLFPIVRDAWVAYVIPPTGLPDFRTGAAAEAVVFAEESLPERALTTFLITFGALGISLPVAWVYTFTRRLRYDPSLVQSVIILPLVVAGIVVIVKNSVALAFSLAGIVAAVRFRNTLKDPKDAVYIFLALGIGIAAGVRALDVALVLSMLFNAVVLVLWKYDLGSIYSGEGRDLLAIGEPSLLIARNSAQRDSIRWRMQREAAGMETDGILIVHTEDPEGARRAVELSLAQTAEDWRIVDNFRRRGGVSTFAALMQLDKKADPLALLADLDERWSGQVNAAEYIPFRMPPANGKEAEST